MALTYFQVVDRGLYQMKKYVLTDKDGFTVKHTQMKAGKFIHPATEESSDPMAQVVNHGADSPLLAVIESPKDLSTSSRLFVLQTWTVGVDVKNPQAYTTVKEVAAPVVSLEQKLAFAVAATGNISSSEDYCAWSQGWLTNADRTAASAQKIRQQLSEEVKAVEGMEWLTSRGYDTGSSHAKNQEQEDITKRCVLIAQATELIAADSPGRDKIAELVAEATHGISRYGEKVDLEVLADKVYSTG